MGKVTSFFKRMTAGIMAALVGSTSISMAQEVLPYPQDKFKGEINVTAKDSTPDYPKPVKAPEGAPNIVVILLDDVGFGATSTFGGPINTPNFDRLAQMGLRYNQFHTTALCSPTRASLLTGRNHHSAHMGVITELVTGYPGYDGIIGKDTATIAEILKQNGYCTSWYGKNHNTPDWETSMVGPFDRWPTGLGFDYFYGFNGADTNEWDPPIIENTTPLEKPKGDRNYHLDKDLADHAIKWVSNQHSIAPDKPFFLYYAPGTSHAPHHAPKEWIEKYKGKFDQGWDKVREETFERQKKLGIIPENTKLTVRPGEIPSWDSLSDKQKKLYARMMEVYAGALSHCDYQVGRVIDALEEMGELDNTIIIYIAGDNGASGEGTLNGLYNEFTVLNAIPEDPNVVFNYMEQLGGPMTYNHYPVGWAHAMDTPFQWTKQVASHFGGTRNGMVISWPEGIKEKGGIRTQFHHVIDIAPTILDAAGIKEPVMVNGVPQKPIEGVSMVYSFNDKNAKSKHKKQYFEMFANRAIYNDGWIASTTPRNLPWIMERDPLGPRDFKWELYNITKDFSQAENVADKYPEKLKEMQDLFLAEAARYNVLPLDNSFKTRVDKSTLPSLTYGRKSFTYYPGTIRIPEGCAPDTKNKSFSITAEVEIPKAGANGILATQGGRFGGWGLYIYNNKPVYVYNLAGLHRYMVTSNDILPPGKVVITYDFKYTGGDFGLGGTGTLYVNGKKEGEVKIERTLPFRFSFDETFDVGEDTGTPIVEDYEIPFKFTGNLKKVTIDLK